MVSISQRLLTGHVYTRANRNTNRYIHHQHHPRRRQCPRPHHCRYRTNLKWQFSAWVQSRADVGVSSGSTHSFCRIQLNHTHVWDHRSCSASTEGSYRFSCCLRTLGSSSFLRSRSSIASFSLEQVATDSAGANTWRLELCVCVRPSNTQ